MGYANALPPSLTPPQHPHPHPHIHTHTHTHTYTHLWGFSRIGVDSTKIIETNHDKKIVPIYNIKREDERMLSCVEERNKIDVVGSSNH